MTGTVWLASYPKSGNTWMRAIVSALGIHRLLFDANHLGSGGQPYVVHAGLPVLGLDPRWLDRGEVEVLRDHLVRHGDPDETPAEGGRPRVRKTHEVYRPGRPGAEPFPADATRAALLVVRDPRDVACSSAPFFGTSLDEAIDRMAVSRDGRPHPFRQSTAQPWGSWSSHAASWLADDVPFPVHLVRYEDLQRDAIATLLPVFAAIGLACTEEELTAAVAQARFERLQEWEQGTAFRETSPRTERFFRSGRAGGWSDELTEEQVLDVEADHAEMMERLGYRLVNDDVKREARAEARRSRRRAGRADWWRLPDHLGLDVVRGPVPDELPGAEKPRPWISVLPDQALVRFVAGGALWVRDGRHVTVDFGDADGGDPSWLVQGWAVTLATLQRGGLSLHAATVRIGDEVVALAGRRGAGKSTTAMALRAAGHELLVDDVTLIQPGPDGRADVLPYSRNVHLLPDAAAAVGLEVDELPALSGARAKVAFRPEDPPEDPVALTRIVVLAPTPGAAPVELTALRGAGRVTALMHHTARDGVAPIVLGRDRYFAELTRLAGAVPVSVLRRPASRDSLPEVVELLTRGG